MNDRRIELITLDRPQMVNQHVTNHRATIDIRIQRTKTVTQLLGQHRNYTTREIHARTADLCIDIQRFTGLHVVTDIGDCDQQTPFRFRDTSGKDRIVKVLRIFPVDRAEGHITKIDTSLTILC